MKKGRLPRRVVLLIAAAVLLLGLSAVGGTWAALSYYSDNFNVQMQTQKMGVTLNENGKSITEGTLLEDLKGKDTNPVVVVPGKRYQEELSVTNSGTMDTYVRVVLRRYWKDGEGKKAQNLSPDTIRLSLNEEDWIEDRNASTAEQTILYYTRVLSPDETSALMCNTLQIDPQVSRQVTQLNLGDEGIVNTVFDYDGYSFCLKAEVDAVQTHNAVEAIKSAWGVDVEIDADGNLSLPYIYDNAE
jgi:hypothetical protein